MQRIHSYPIIISEQTSTKFYSFVLATRKVITKVKHFFSKTMLLNSKVSLEITGEQNLIFTQIAQSWVATYFSIMLTYQNLLKTLNASTL